MDVSIEQLLVLIGELTVRVRLLEQQLAAKKAD